MKAFKTLVDLPHAALSTLFQPLTFFFLFCSQKSQSLPQSRLNVCLDVECFSPRCLFSLSVFIFAPKSDLIRETSWATLYKMANPASLSVILPPNMPLSYASILINFSP